MKLLVISSAPVIFKNNTANVYAPYAKELEIWAGHTSQIALCCPVWPIEGNLLIAPLSFKSNMYKLYEFNIQNTTAIFKSILFVLVNMVIIFRAMCWADHIHIRCPGNIGLLACIVQVFFPFKPKTAKYAGNWDPNAIQPLSYKLQKSILQSTVWSRRMIVLVYGNWSGVSSNVRPFFTASYRENEIRPLRNISLYHINIVFAGVLADAKHPEYAIKLAEVLKSYNLNVSLDIFGDGPLRSFLVKYIDANNLSEFVKVHGNKNHDVIRHAYSTAHFVILPSESEGWPKVIAEGMFWGAVPLATSVSCVPFMLDYGKRGIILKMQVEEDAAAIKNLCQNSKEYYEMRNAASMWSRKYTLDVFEKSILQFLDR